MADNLEELIESRDALKRLLQNTKLDPELSAQAQRLLELLDRDIQKAKAGSKP